METWFLVCIVVFCLAGLTAVVSTVVGVTTGTVSIVTVKERRMMGRLFIFYFVCLFIVFVLFALLLWHAKVVLS